MEETLAGVVAELDKVIRPLGFKIMDIDRREKTPMTSGSLVDAGDDSELRLTIVRKGKLG